MSDLLSLDWVPVVIGVVGMLTLTCLVLYRSALAVGISPSKAAAVVAMAALLLGGWVVASALLALAGAYVPQGRRNRGWMGVASLVVLVLLLLGTRLPIVARILAAPGTPARLAVPQSLRALGAIFLVVLAQGYLPAVFAIPAGLGDVAVGLAAPFVAARLSRPSGRRAAIVFNLLGILDLMVAVTVGSLAGLAPYRLIQVTPSTAGLGLLPLALIPSFAVPLALALHIVSLARLRRVAQPPQPVPELVSGAK